ncbi:MAG: DMT family transporter [Cellulomonadaceae bacterium]
MRSILLVLAAAVLFGTTGTAQALGPEASALSVGAVRTVLGGLVLALLAGVAGRSRAARAGRPTGPRAGARSTRTRALPTAWVSAAGAAGVACYSPTFFAGTAANGVAVGTVVSLGSAPVITGALQWAATRRFPGAVWAVATCVATTGVAVLARADGAAASAGGLSLPGLLASLGAGASYATYTMSSKALLERGWTPLTTMGTVFGLAAVVSLPLLALAPLGWLGSGSGLVMALWLGFVTVALAYVLFARGLAVLPASTVATLTLAEPVAASTLALVVLGEQWTPQETAGLAVVAAGIVVLTLGSVVRRPRIAART